MKKIISAIIAIIMLVSVFGAGVYADEVNETMKIEFCVGDDTLIINGETVQVEKPYVVGVGVTLVPLRVITEAFGAEVEWIDETHEINLKYPDVNIHLQIGNPIAEVNGKAENLLSAPELTNSRTMVPLRFISETFGASVSYDEKTERIVVIKENTHVGTTIEGDVTSSKIGDSYYGWSMDNPTEMQLDYRSFDGLFTEFVYDDSNYITLGIYTISEDFDFEKEFNSRKSSLQGYTLVKADKDSGNSLKRTMHFQVRDKSAFGNIRVIVTDKYLFDFVGTFSNDNNELKEKFIGLMSTFDTVYSGEDIHDYSGVKDGVRTYEAENLNLSFNVPADYYMATSSDSENKFIFYRQEYDDQYSHISFSVYSKSDVGSAEEMANKDYTNNKLDTNEELVTFGNSVEAGQYGEISAYEYSYEINSSSEQSRSRDIFFEKGDYVYNCYLCRQLPCDNFDDVVNSFMMGIKAEKIDADKVGILMRNIPESSGTYTSKFNNLSLEIPNNYEEEVQGTQAVYRNQSNAVMISVIADKSAKTLSTLKTNIKELEKLYKDDYLAETVFSTKESTVNGVKCVKFTVHAEQYDDAVYMECYGTVKNGCGYVFLVVYPEISYSKNVRSEVEAIVSSLN